MSARSRENLDCIGGAPVLRVVDKPMYDEAVSALREFVSAAKSWHDFHHGSNNIACDWLCECIPAGEAVLAKAAKSSSIPAPLASDGSAKR